MEKTTKRGASRYVFLTKYYGVIKQGRIRCAGYVACMDTSRNTDRVLAQKDLRERNHMADLN
jgi:hypothetical protein